MSIKKAKSEKRAFVIGLDGATFDLIEPWIDKGELPNLSELSKESARGKLLSTIPPLSPPAWASFATGCNPGKHGIFDFYIKACRTYEKAPVSSRTVASETLWKILERNGKKIGLLNVPLTYPPTEIKGFMVSGLGAPSFESEFTYPSNLKDELKKVIGDYVIDVEYDLHQKIDVDEFSKDLEKMIEFRKRACIFLMEKYSWDFFMVVFVGIDRIQHLGWEKNSNEFKAILKIHKKIDEAIGEILSKLDENTIVVILSDHGFHQVYKKFCVNTFLKKLGLLKTRRRLDILFFFYQFFELSIRKLPSFVKRRILRIFDSFISKYKKKTFISNINWQKTKAYMDSQFGISINLKKREPQGIVDLDECEKIKNFLIKNLKELCDPETGEKIIKAAFKREEIYSGNHLSESPDILFSLKPGYNTSEKLISKITSQQTNTSGFHSMNGIFMIRDRRIIKKKSIEEARILDITPTILYLMGVPVPKSMDGRVLTELFKKEYLKSNPIEYVKEDIKVKKTKLDVYSKEDQERIEKRLKGLGYL